MLTYTPIVSSRLPFFQALRALSFSRRQEKELARTLEEYHGNRGRVFLKNSGTGALLVLLRALRSLSDRTEVILPAYSAVALVQAVHKAGLTPVLCDVTPDTCGLDTSMLPSLVNERTLALIWVHLFGIVDPKVALLEKKYPLVCIIEDCSQSFGAEIGGIPAGSLTAASFSSFNRGKPLAAYGGGYLHVRNGPLEEAVAHGEGSEHTHAGVSGTGITSNLAAWIRITGLSLVTLPFWYGIASPFLSGLKERLPPAPEEPGPCPCTSCNAVLRLLDRREKDRQKRIENTTRILQGLKSTSGIALPQLPADTISVLNRLPLRITRSELIPRLQNALKKRGIEASRMYPAPLQVQCRLAISEDAFPVSRKWSTETLTVPVHPGVTGAQCLRIAQTIHDTLTQL